MVGPGSTLDAESCIMRCRALGFECLENVEWLPVGVSTSCPIKVPTANSVRPY